MFGVGGPQYINIDVIFYFLSGFETVVYKCLLILFTSIFLGQTMQE